jgi:ATP-dependent Lon protease
MQRSAQIPIKKPRPTDGGITDLNPYKEDEFSSVIKNILVKLDSSKLPPDLKEETKETLKRLTRAMEHSLYQIEFEQTTKYIDWLLELPWDKRTKDNLDLEKGKKTLDKNHYGLASIKERILEYLAVLKIQSEEQNGVIRFTRSPILCFVGLPGTGKTSLAASIAETLGRQFVRIAMGGISSPLMLRGQPRAYPEAEPGLIIRGMRRAGAKNPVVLLDEIDSIAEGSESDIMGVLLELLDPEQNNAFTDYYIDYPFDLSEVLFVCSANKIGNVTPAVLDRLEVIIMPRYTDDDKIRIARDYLFPRELATVGLQKNYVKISDDAWPHIIKPFGYDVDIRALQRTINGILRKVAKKSIEEKLSQIAITPANLPEFLPEFV